MTVSNRSNPVESASKSGLLYSPFNTISVNYGPPTAEAFEELCDALDSCLTSTQRVSLRALRKFVVTENQLRPLGAMMPFFVADFFGLDSSAAKKVSSSWVALYLWSIVVDKAMDGEEVSLTVDHMLFAQLLTYFLQEVGGADLSHSVRKDIISDLSMAMRFQSYSVPNTTLDGSASLSEIRAGKNLLFLAIGRLVCSPYTSDLKPLQRLCERFSGVLQALDDLTDIRIDLGLGIQTPIIEALALPEPTPDLGADDLVSILVSSGALSRELKWASDELRIILSTCPNIKGHSYQFISHLNDMICEISALADRRDTNRVKQRITGIYCST